MKFIKTISLFIFLSLLVITSHHSLKYIHWQTKSAGYPGFYDRTELYSFKNVVDSLTNMEWRLLASDQMGDGDIPNWADADKLYVYNTIDTVWLRFTLHNHLDINEPMVSLAIEDNTGNEWYGTIKDFKYRDIISVGYYRKGSNYLGYNFIASEEGVCTLRYDLATNALFLGIPTHYLQKYKDKEFIASVGQKGLWNDDLDSLLSMNLIFK